MRFGEAIERAARHIVRLMRPTGRFIYCYDSEARVQLPGYNVLRHCGTIWAVGTAAEAGLVLPETAVALQPALASVLALQTGLRPDGTMYVHEQGEVKLGANALAVLALCTMPQARDRAGTLRRLCGYIEQQADGPDDFVHKRRQDTMAALPFRSDYYTGEALFAVVMAARLLDDGEMLDGAERRLHSLVARRYGIAEQSHWMMYAVAALHEMRPAKALAGYACHLTSAIIDGAGYRAGGACTPVACRTEALLAATSMLRRYLPAGERLLADARAVIEENLTIQLACMEPDGGFRCDPQTPVVRIDYIQHNLASFVAYEQVSG